MRNDDDETGLVQPHGAQQPFAALETAQKSGKRAANVLISLHVARTLARLGFLAAAAMVAGRLVMGQDVQAILVVGTLILLALAALAGLASEDWQARAEADVSAAIRAEASQALDAMPTRQVQQIPTGQLVAGMQRHPEAIASLVLGHRAATRMMSIGPLMAAAALFAVSWQAAFAVLALTPLMIIFFVLVGDTIRKRSQAQERAFSMLAGQFADRIRTLPTIAANHAVDIEGGKLRQRLRAYADRTMGVLRVAFLNAAIIDFFASLSIAMLAVFLGLGHLGLARIPGFSGLELWQSLFILMIAPEYFAPFRRFAEQYHAKADGETAAIALNAMLAPTQVAAFPSLPAAPDLPPRGLVAITGPSGSGKTTLLRHLAGVDGDSREPVAGAISWISTDSFVPEGSLAQALRWNNAQADDAGLRDAAARAGLIDDAYLPGGLDSPIQAGGGNLSGGQRVRIAVARALLGARMTLADEPTAKLDPENAERIRAALRDLSRSRLVIVATHDPELAKVADRIVLLHPVNSTEQVP